MNQDILARLRDYFRSHPKVAMAFLFGSRSRGRNGPDSDFDFGVYFLPEYTRRDIYRMWNELEDLLGKQVDLVVLNETTPLLAWTALKGRRLFVRDANFYLRYMLSISREAEDFQQFLLDWWRWRMKIRGAV
ncbi:MAG: type VII toxin-antitoxin system MntA family adenylyltransferase antitoxin [Desulfotomaculales bacterium]